jgi:GNAT superfamily N-acetyltransferase
MIASEIIIDSAHPTDAQRLTAIAHAAKRHWGYSDDLIALWEDDLTVTPAFIADHPVFCAVQAGVLIGFYALSRTRDDQAESVTDYTDFTDAADFAQDSVKSVESVAAKPVFELEHMWVTPQHIGTGVGKLLFDHAVLTARLLGGFELTVVSDPHAEGFYLRMGARRVGEAPSKPEGRTLPFLALDLEPRQSPSMSASACCSISDIVLKSDTAARQST